MNALSIDPFCRRRDDSDWFVVGENVVHSLGSGFAATQRVLAADLIPLLHAVVLTRSTKSGDGNCVGACGSQAVCAPRGRA